jgi:hypothetical protein
MSAFVITPKHTITVEGNNLKLGAGAVAGSWIIFPAGNVNETKAVIHPGPDTVVVISDQPPPIQAHDH